MKEIVSIVNQKGGVGKTSTAHALGAGLRNRGHNVLFVDLDPQGNLSYILQAKAGPSAYDLLTKRAGVDEVLQSGPQGDFIPSGPALATADMDINTTGKEYRLKEVLSGLSYDFIVIDTPPALGILTVNALTASNSIIIPAQADIFSLQGIGQLYGTIQAVTQYCNPALAIRGILLTRHTNRTVLSREVADMIADTAAQLDTKVFETAIRENVAVKEAQASKDDIFSYAPRSNAANDYSALIQEMEV